MLILALDTATRAGSCALARDGVVLREHASDASAAQASRLPGELMTLLEAAGVALPQIDLYAVATGPGSFTGLRVGIATMQGLAFAAGRPLIGVSAFDALAATAHAAAARAHETGADRALPVAAWIDAWRGEVYAALYDGTREIEPPVVGMPAALLAARAGASTRFTGDGAQTYRDLIDATLGQAASVTDPVVPLLAGTISGLAAAAARAGHRPPPHALRPLYVRRPDAELARDARTGR